MQINAANQETSAMNQDVAAQISREQAYGKKANQVVNQNIQTSAAPNAQAQIAKGAANQLAQYSMLQGQPTTTAPSATPDNRVTSAESGATTSNLNQAAAKLAGYGSWENAQSIADQNTNNQLGVINSQANAWQPVLSSQLSDAQSSQGGEAAAGSLLSSAGGIAGAYGAASPYLTALRQYTNQINGTMPGSNQPNTVSD